MAHHIYGGEIEALHDLQIMSGLNLNQNKTLYLVGVPGKWFIVDQPYSDSVVHAIAYGGVLFKPY